MHYLTSLNFDFLTNRMGIRKTLTIIFLLTECHNNCQHLAQGLTFRPRVLHKCQLLVGESLTLCSFGLGFPFTCIKGNWPHSSFIPSPFHLFQEWPAILVNQPVLPS